jgi:hypothetical protein
MKVIWTLKNNPSPHIHAKATEFPQSSAFNQRKFMSQRGNHYPATWASRILKIGAKVQGVWLTGTA